MNTTFVIYKMFADKTPAQILGRLLEANQIEYIIEDNSSLLDASFAGGAELAKEFAVCVSEADVSRVNKIIEASAESDMANIDADYYLNEFTDDELREVVLKSDEWNEFDVVLAKKMLKQRGIELSAEDLSAFREQRIEMLARPEKSQIYTVLFGYVFALLSGVIGIAIGWFLYTQKKTLPNGKKVYSFNSTDRKHGGLIMFIGGGLLTAIFIWQIFMPFFFEY
jgi:hypothetical protein